MDKNRRVITLKLNEPDSNITLTYHMSYQSPRQPLLRGDIPDNQVQVRPVAIIPVDMDRMISVCID